MGPNKPHPCTIHNFANHIRTRREILLEDRLSLPPHICEHSLPEVPPAELITWSLRILKEGLIEMLAGNVHRIAREADDLIIVLRIL